MELYPEGEQETMRCQRRKNWFDGRPICTHAGGRTAGSGTPFGSLRQATQNGPNLFNIEGKTVGIPDIRHPNPYVRPPDCMIPTPLAIYYA